MNECGDCTLCCKLLETHDIPSEIGVYCHHCKKGCEIYEQRPKECQDYQCMWSQMDMVTEDLRPDKCSILFDRIADDVIVARLEEGSKLSGLTFSQVNRFVGEGFSVVVFRGKHHKHFMSANHTKEYVMETIRGCA